MNNQARIEELRAEATNLEIEDLVNEVLKLCDSGTTIEMLIDYAAGSNHLPGVWRTLEVLSTLQYMLENADSPYPFQWESQFRKNHYDLKWKADWNA